jgi:hypothetical protein
VVMPEPYRSFAALIGDGCPAGPPSYGLVPLRQAASCGWRGGDGLARLARPFRLTSPEIWEDGEPPPEPGITRDRVWDGTLLLGHDGCGMYPTLVVTGAHRGHIWNVTDVGAQPLPRRCSQCRPPGRTRRSPYLGFAVRSSPGRPGSRTTSPRT